MRRLDVLVVAGAEVALAGRCVSQPGLDQRDGRVAVPAVHVADGRDADVRVGHEFLEPARAHSTDANERQLDLVARRRRLREQRSVNHRGQASGGPEEDATRDSMGGSSSRESISQFGVNGADVTLTARDLIRLNFSGVSARRRPLGRLASFIAAARPTERRVDLTEFRRTWPT